MSNHNLTPAEIQKILEEQRATAEIYKRTDASLAIRSANYDKSSDPLWREKVSKGSKGHKKPEGFSKKISAFQKNRPKSEETKLKLSEIAKNRKPNPEAWAKISVSNTGKVKSEETKEKLRIKALERGARRPEDVAKMSATKRSKSKPIITPFGIFGCRAEAIEFYNSTFNSSGGRDHMSSRLNKKPTEYYYITREEYERLTNNSI